MLCKMLRKEDPDGQRPAFSFPMACLLAVITATAAGCASAPSYRTHPDLPQKKGVIRTVGLLSPMITMYEEQSGKLVPHDDWAPDAAKALRKAFIEETAAGRLPLTIVDDQEANDILDLFSAVDLSIQRHAYENKSEEYPPREPFPEKLLSFRYSLGPAREMMERHQVDAIWVITGFNLLLPTTGSQAREVAIGIFDIFSIMINVALAAGGAMGGGASGGFPLLFLEEKIEIRAAFVDKSGEIIFYTRLDALSIPQARQKLYDAVQGERTIEAEEFVKKDIRDPKIAGHYIKALLAEYQEAAQ